MLKPFHILMLSSLSILNANAQELSQTIRGKVVDRPTQMPLPGATIMIADLPVTRGAVSDDTGTFSIANVPLGRHLIKITFVGYEPVLVSNVLVGSGKEVVLTIEMVESPESLDEVVINAGKFAEVVNEMTQVSARSFTEEETRRFPASVGDPLRLAASFAGTAALDDESNEIIIRGNTPRGILWKLEGVEIPSPNHFSAEGTSSGGISMFSTQVISRSDFVTSAFAPEYGNATAGVFDIHLRNGNNSSHERTAQAGLLGLDFSAEGPLPNKTTASYLFNYRYSTLSLLSKLGLDIQDPGEDNTFQDVSFKLNLPTPTATWSLFGLAGLSTAQQKLEGVNDRETYNLGVLGLSLQKTLRKNTLLRATLSTSHTTNQDILKTQGGFDDSKDFARSFNRLNIVVNQKINATHWLENGLVLSNLTYNFDGKTINPANPPPYNEFNTFDESGQTFSQQAFSSWHYRPSTNLSSVIGIHLFRLALNNELSIEPRASLKYAATPGLTLRAAYGMHSRMESLEYYLGVTTDPNGNQVQNNKDLGLTKAHHAVVGASYQLSRLTEIKTELYYQKLFRVPVLTDKSGVPFSSLNFTSGYSPADLSNTGTGTNYGIEWSAERKFAGTYFCLLNGSLYNSTYTASDLQNRNTRFNGNFASNLLAGREFKASKNSTIGVNTRLNYSGNKRYVPINLPASTAANQEIRDPSQAFNSRYPDFFRLDLQLNWRRNGRHYTSEVRLDIQNATNHKNVVADYFSNGSMSYVKGPGMIPVVSYRIEF